ncbi:Uncharacterised protein [Bordetella pertussis]|nr:Uncharacterised protein [Bordetella pertussis]CFE03606.1 Uncharacterised protein [Bordetella pertussis]CFL89188.1 Uncharacterised protein [Bordetella pertussis]CFM19621.1 Uncharacterised protein [Bordetella pertussis]CFM35143.1 Uncharacterised protein [Bordetella pertussis]
MRQADAAGLGAAEGAGGKKQVGGARRPQHVAHALDAVERVAQAEPRGRHAKARALVAIAQVAGQRQAHAAAHADAAHQRDGGHGALGQGLLRLRHRAVIARDLRGILALRGELGNIGAGHEGALALAFEHDGAQIVAALRVAHRLAQRFPHGQRHGVVARRVDDAHAQQPVGVVDGQAAGRMGVRAHGSGSFVVQTAPAARSLSISSSP